MTDVLGFAAYLLLPFIGIAIWRLDAVRRLALDGKLAVAGAAGALLVTLTMTFMTIVGLSWSRTRLFAVFGLLAVVGVGMFLRSTRMDTSLQPARSWPALIGILFIFAVTTWGLLTARETCGDLLFFWGPKGIHFFRAGKIDFDYLFDWNNLLAHRDYPPLLPLLYAWSHTMSREFSWWGALMFSGLCLAGIVAIVRAGARSDTAGLLAAAALAYALATSYAPGGADPLLLLFEATAVIAIVFIDDVHVQWILVAIGVAGAALTKVEGCAFAAAVVVALLMVRRKPLLLMAAVLPAALLLAAWLAVIAHAGMLDAYEGSGPLHLRYVWRVVPETLRMASYQAGWIPWIAPLIVIALGDLRRAVLPLTMAALTFGATIFFYLHGEEDPTSFWIRSSAPRVLLTPLLMLLIAAAAALREGSKVRRLPPSSPAPDLPLPRPE